MRAIRQWLGLSPDAVGSYTKTSRAVVLATEEKDTETPEMKKISKWLSSQLEEVRVAQTEKEAFTKHFEAGKKYRISSNHYKTARENAKSGTNKGDCTFLGTTWEGDCTFEFVKDEGIHHCFKAVPGGWSRTYTDAQLVGKKIEEVKV